MEIFTLLETLEEMLENSKTIPFSNKSVIDKEEMLEIIKEIRLKLPDELKQAKWIKEERQRILVEAQKEADDIVKEAENRIISMIDEHEITRKAYEQKAQIIETANEQFNKFIINKQEEIKFYENKNMFLKKMNLIYRSKIIPKKNMFKNEINLNLNISQETQNNNEISMINQINNGENLESNINNTFYELFTVESVAKSGMINNSTFIQDEDIYK